MRVERKSLISLESAYAVTARKFGEQTFLFVGSEGRGGATLMLRGPEWTSSTIGDGPGGNMAIIPVPPFSGVPNSLLIIDGFFPIFQSEGAGAEIGTNINLMRETEMHSLR